MSSGHPTRVGGCRESIPVSQRGAAVPRHGQDGGPQNSAGYSPEPQLSSGAATGCSHIQWSRTTARGTNEVTEEMEVSQRGREGIPNPPLPHQASGSPHRLICGSGRAVPPCPPCPQPRTFNAADDFEAAGGEPIGDEEEDGNQGGIEQAVVVQGCPLHGSIPCARSCPQPAPPCNLGQPCPSSPPARGAATAGREAGGRTGRQAGNWERCVRARLPNQLP